MYVLKCVNLHIMVVEQGWHIARRNIVCCETLTRTVRMLVLSSAGWIEDGLSRDISRRRWERGSAEWPARSSLGLRVTTGASVGTGGSPSWKRLKHPNIVGLWLVRPDRPFTGTSKGTRLEIITLATAGPLGKMIRTGQTDLRLISMHPRSWHHSP